MNTQKFQPRNLFLRMCSLLLALTMALTATGPAFATQPSNDDFDSAFVIAAPPANLVMNETDFNDSTPAFDDPPTACSGTPYLHTIWYAYTSPFSGQVKLDTFGSNFDTIIAVWTGTRGSLVEVGCNDDSTGLLAELTFVATQGVTYYIEVLQYTTSSAPEKEFGAVVESSLSSDYMTLNLSLPGYAGPGKYDNKDTSLFVFPSGWKLVSQGKAYLASIHTTSGTNPVNVKFYGNQLRLTFTKSVSYGNLLVSIDGGAATTVAQKKTTAAYQQTWPSALLSEGYHTAQFVRSSGTVNIDAVEFFATQDIILPNTITNLNAVSGVTDGTVNLFWTAPGDDGNAGIARSYDVRYSTAPITLANFAVAKKPTGIPVPHLPGTGESMTVTGLAPGVDYHFAVRTLDDNYSLSGSTVTGPNTSALSNVPTALATYSGIVAVAGTYQNDAPEWTYTGTWPLANSTQAQGGNYQTTLTNGNSALFVFNGTRFDLFYCVASTFGKITVYVDGVLRATINQYSLTPVCNKKYSLPAAMPAGQHSVKVVSISNKKITIDAITIFP